MYKYKVFKFIFDNRRPIGLIIGGIFTIAGYPDVAPYFQRVGEV